MHLYGAPKFRTNQASIDNSYSNRESSPFDAKEISEISQQQKIIKSIIASPTNLIKRVKFDDPEIEIPKLFVKKTHNSKLLK